MGRLLAGLAAVLLVAGCEQMKAMPVLGAVISNAPAARPYAPEAGSILLTGKPLAANAFSLLLRDGCDKLIEPDRIARCEARNTGPRSRNR